MPACVTTWWRQRGQEARPQQQRPHARALLLKLRLQPSNATLGRRQGCEELLRLRGLLAKSQLERFSQAVAVIQVVLQVLHLGKRATVHLAAQLLVLLLQPCHKLGADNSTQTLVMCGARATAPEAHAAYNSGFNWETPSDTVVPAVASCSSSSLPAVTGARDDADTACSASRCKPEHEACNVAF